MTDPTARPGFADAYRIPGNQELSEPLDFAYQVFSTDPRVIKRAMEKFEIQALKPDAFSNLKTDEEEAEAREKHRESIKQAVLRLWHVTKNAPRLARHQKGWASCPEQAWYDEAKILGERVGKRWETTPIPTLVEALKDGELLQALAFPRVTIEPGRLMNLVTQTYCVFRGRRLVLGSESDSSKLVIHDLRIGKNSMFFNACAVYGGCFSDVAFPFRLKLDTMQVAQLMTLYVENVSDEHVTVSPTMFGVGMFGVGMFGVGLSPEEEAVLYRYVK